MPSYELVLKADGTPDYDKLPEELVPIVKASFQMGTKTKPLPSDFEEVLKAERDERAKLEGVIKVEQEKRELIEKNLAEEREQRVTREWIAKAAAYADLPTTAADFGPVLKEAAEKLQPETFTKLETVLKAANEIARQSALLGEFGRIGVVGGGGDAFEAIEKLADGLVQKSTDGLTKQQAIDRVLKTAEGKQLYAQYEREQDEARRAVS